MLLGALALKKAYRDSGGNRPGRASRRGGVLAGFLVFPFLNPSVCREDRYLDIGVLARASCFGLLLDSTVVPPKAVLRKR